MTYGSKWKKKVNSCVYLIEFEDGCKIGQTSDSLSQRLNSYKKPWCKPIKRVFLGEPVNPKFKKKKGDYWGFHLEGEIMYLLDKKKKKQRIRKTEFFNLTVSSIKRLSNKIVKWTYLQPVSNVEKRWY